MNTATELSASPGTELPLWLQLLPILLFEVAWKLIWLGVVALPLWLDHAMDRSARELTNEILWVIVILAVIPWRYAFSHYLARRGDRWR